MKIEKVYSHLNGEEWMMVRRPILWREIRRVIRGINANACRTKVSKEKTKLGKKLFSPKELNKCFKVALNQHDWLESRVSYWVTDDHQLIRQTLGDAPEEQKKKIIESGKEPIYSYNQTDFVKSRVAVEVQFGKYSFIAYDLFVKHLAFYVGDKIDCGIEILPMKSLQAEMSSGPGYYEGALYDLVREGRGVPAVPIVLIGVSC
jgi:hypothetical protein